MAFVGILCLLLMFQLEIVLSWSSPPFYDTEIALTSSVDSFTSWTIYNDCLSTDIRVMLVCILVIMISLLLPKLSGRVLRKKEKISSTSDLDETVALLECGFPEASFSETYKDKMMKQLRHGCGELIDDNSCWAVFSDGADIRGDHEGNSARLSLTSLSPPRYSTHSRSLSEFKLRHDALQSSGYSPDCATSGEGTCKTRSSSDSMPTQCARILNWICVSRTKDILSGILGGIEFLPHTPACSSEVTLVQVVGFPEGSGTRWICTAVVTCLSTITSILRSATSSAAIFLLPENELIDNVAFPSWMSDLCAILLDSGLKCRLIQSFNAKSTRPITYMISIQDGDCVAAEMKTVTTLRWSLQDKLGLTMLNEEIWHWKKGSKLLSLTLPNQNLVETLRNLAICEFSDCEWLELENIIRLRKCSYSKDMTVHELIGLIKKKKADANTYAVVTHFQQQGLLLCFLSSDTILKNVEVSDGSGHPQLSLQTSTQFGLSSLDDSGFSQGSGLSSVFVTIHPESFVSLATKCCDDCHFIDVEVNSTLISAARRHGLLPKDNVMKVLQSRSPAGLSYSLHVSGTLLDPALCQCSSHCQQSLPNCMSMKDCYGHQAFYLFPSALKLQALPALYGYRSISSLAFRSPGVVRVDIPLLVYYYVVVHLIKHFPDVKSCAKRSFRFQVYPHHLLDVEYHDYYISIVVQVVKGKDNYSLTAEICKNIRTRISSYLQATVALYESFSGLSFVPCVLLSNQSEPHNADFVSLPNVRPSTSSAVFLSTGGLEMLMPEDLCFWYGETIQKTSLIQTKFVEYSEKIDAYQAASFLYSRELLTKSDLDTILTSDENTQAGKLLRILEGKTSIDDDTKESILANGDLHLKKKNYVQVNMGGMRIQGKSDDRSFQFTPGEDQTPTLPSAFQSSFYEQQISKNSPQHSDRVDARLKTMNVKPVQCSGLHNVEESSIDPSLAVVSRGRIGSTQDEMISRHVPPSCQKALAPVSPSLIPTQKNVEPDLSRSSGLGLEGETMELVFHLASDAVQQSVPSPAIASLDKEEPEIHPIYESKYYHVQRATDSFNDRPVKEGGKRLGVGSFGMVFLGMLHSETGQKYTVAVKRFKKASSLNPTQTKLSRKQFGVEMNILTRYVHPNVVRLLGFSSDGPELCLIYEYMERGALSHRLDCKKDYMEDVSRQNVDLAKMLDPRARWPKERDRVVVNKNVGLELLNVAHNATTRDYNRRPNVDKVAGLLKPLVDMTN
ncbi:uncharacterized protein LOC134181325 isoform X2 [Corticium candelabrum]|uniref:uncharacterized protein LOC134181325 isoform X2 n=1 Tax=Corticium candelabrum TaxID=121492 RepID=UPI002E275F3D|nr:uncharacterized protein LOC134181325 isoform X2 [Corticium candelabrum]